MPNRHVKRIHNSGIVRAHIHNTRINRMLTIIFECRKSPRILHMTVYFSVVVGGDGGGGRCFYPAEWRKIDF